MSDVTTHIRVGWDNDESEDEVDTQEVVASIELVPIEPGDPTVFIKDPIGGDYIQLQWLSFRQALDRAARSEGYDDFESFVEHAGLVAGHRLKDEDE